MAYKTKRLIEASKSVEAGKVYESNEAMKIVVDNAKAKFDETVELHIKLGVDPRHADQQVRGVCVLPNGTGKKVKVLVIAKGDKADAAQAAGADYVGGEEIIAKIQKENWFDFDVCITTPDMMGLVGRIGKLLGPKGLMPNPKSGTVTPDMMGMVGRIARLLGPKGLMPNPKSGTVTNDLTKAIADVKAGKVEYRLDKTAIIHVPIGKVSFGVEKLMENFNTVMEAVVKAKPAAAKGQYLRSITLSSTMGIGVKIVYNA